MIQEINKCSRETKGLSIDILENINLQGKQIDNLHSNVKYTVDVTDKSKWILNNMTWFGWFKNLFRKTPTKELMIRENAVVHRLNHSVEVNEKTHVDKSDIKPYIIPNSIAFNKELKEIEDNLKTLYNVSLEIGVELDKQNNSLETVNYDVENANDKIKSLHKKINNQLSN